jgi:hypothetical protein
LTTGTEQEARPRPPSLLDAVLPVVVLIGLIAVTIALFGISATAVGELIGTRNMAGGTR